MERGHGQKEMKIVHNQMGLSLSIVIFTKVMKKNGVINMMNLGILLKLT